MQVSTYDGLKFNAYLMSASGRAVAIKAEDVTFEQASAVRELWKDSDYFVVISIVGSQRDLILSDNLKEY